MTPPLACKHTHKQSQSLLAISRDFSDRLLVPSRRLALRYPGTEFGANVLVDDDGSGAFVDQTTEDGRAITTQGVHTVTVKLPDTLTCDGVAPADLCQLQWVLASDLAHEGGAYSLGCADVRISSKSLRNPPLITVTRGLL